MGSLGACIAFVKKTKWICVCMYVCVCVCAMIFCLRCLIEKSNVFCIFHGVVIYLMLMIVASADVNIKGDVSELCIWRVY